MIYNPNVIEKREKLTPYTTNTCMPIISNVLHTYLSHYHCQYNPPPLHPPQTCVLATACSSALSPSLAWFTSPYSSTRYTVFLTPQFVRRNCKQRGQEPGLDVEDLRHTWLRGVYLLLQESAVDDAPSQIIHPLPLHNVLQYHLSRWRDPQLTYTGWVPGDWGGSITTKLLQCKSKGC